MKYKLLAVAIAASLGLAGCGQPEQAQEQTSNVEAPEMAAELFFWIIVVMKR